MANRRTYTDEQLREAVASASCWSAVMQALGKSPGNGTQAVKAVAARLGLDTSHFAYKRSFMPVPAIDMLIPISVVEGMGMLMLDEKYAAFVV